MVILKTQTFDHRNVKNDKHQQMSKDFNITSYGMRNILTVVKYKI